MRLALELVFLGRSTGVEKTVPREQAGLLNNIGVAHLFLPPNDRD